jgi:hypothetical protein
LCFTQVALSAAQVPLVLFRAVSAALSGRLILIKVATRSLLTPATFVTHVSSGIPLTIWIVSVFCH